jgi:hypothetical protein
LFHPEDRKNIDAYIASVRGYDKEPEIPVSMSIEKAEWPRMSSMFKELFPHLNPEGFEEFFNAISDAIDAKDIEQDHYGSKADIIDIDEFKTEEEEKCSDSNSTTSSKNTSEK